jgi:hypothetical protein
MSIMPRYGQYQATISSSYLLSQKVFFCASSNSQYGSSVSGARAAAAKGPMCTLVRIAWSRGRKT